jgi:hypothetical protein
LKERGLGCFGKKSGRGWKNEGFLRER